MDLSTTALTGTYSVPVVPPVAPTPIPTAMVYSLDTGGSHQNMVTTQTRLISIQNVHEIIQSLQPGIVGALIIDLENQSQSINEILRDLWSNVIAFPVIVTGKNRSTAQICDLLRRGVSDYVAQPYSGEQLDSAIQRVLELDNQGSPSPCQIRSRFGELTRREREVMRHCLDGAPTKTIAKNLNVTFQTIDKHRARSLRKLGVGSLLELVRLLLKSQQFPLLQYV